MKKVVLRLIMFMYRLTGGGGKMEKSVLLLTTRIRETGEPTTNPLHYLRDGDAYVVVASNRGQDPMPSWYLNLEQDRNVDVQVGKRRFPARAEDAPPEDRQRLWEARVGMEPGIVEEQKKTTRVFPIVRLIPN